ncbi:MAG: FKBP-type peptidyl-prolyl cis-trans isomerase [Muribaculaceae bacterium]|nr:FKBP-type peptidyl-prolyl cis-trans isomerase [Muribaculaceae bacterium]
MKKLLLAIALVATLMGVTSCLKNGVEDEYKTWRKLNEAWFEEQAMLQDESGKLYYEKVVAPWDPNAKVLVHWFNDTTLTKDNLKPLYTSTVDVKYHGRLIDDTPFDSSYVSTSPADSVTRFTINQTIEGWGIAMPRMHVGDSCRIVVSYQQAYGTYSIGDVILPYSVLQFDVKLVDVHKYEVKE